MQLRPMLGVVAGVAIGALGYALLAAPNRASPRSEGLQTVPERAPTSEHAPVPPPRMNRGPTRHGAIASNEPGPGLRWLAAASGATPESNQVSLEQDLALAAEIFGPDGLVLFGAGAASPTVQVLDLTRASDPLRDRLADMFAPRAGRDARYRESDLGVAAATADAVRDALVRSVSAASDPLLLYVGGHGTMGQTARDNAVEFWGPSRITVGELAEILDAGPREVRIIATTCFSGGFAELAFAGADPNRGAPKTTRCGVFAAPWDLEASGCDPNPDRRQQEGYGLHFLQALAGRDRGGNEATGVDLDGDGEVSLLEAHTQARIASRGPDVPTTTSERWLREVASGKTRHTATPLPEEDAVVTVLSGRLSLPPRRPAVQRAFDTLQRDLEQADRTLAAAQQAEDDAFRAAAADLLQKWPVLDDPWHPQFEATLGEEADAIAHALDNSASYAGFVAATDEVGRLTTALWDLRTQSAQVERLLRALENRELAGRLRATGGPAWATYQRLLTCERSLPRRR